MATRKVYTALALLAFIGVACISSVHAHAPAPAPVHHKPVIVKECNDVCKDKCFQDVQKKCFDVPYQEQVCTQVSFIVHEKRCEKVCVEPKGYDYHGKKGLRRLSQYAAAAASAGSDFSGFDQGKGKAYHLPASTGKGKGHVHVPIHVPAPICHDNCFEVPVTKFRPECKAVTKYRKECKDEITKICKKECVPVCIDVPAGKGKYGR